MSYIGSNPLSQSFAPGTDTFSGTGSQTAFTLSRNVATVNDILVIVNNVEQQPSNYTVSTSTLTFSAAPSSGTNNIYVRYLSTNITAIVPSATGTANSTTFLRGDNTWAAVSVTATAVSDQTNTSTGYFDLPSGTTAQRPVSPASGMIRYNTTKSAYEVYSESTAAWVSVSTTNTEPYNVDYLIVAGGGGGGRGAASGASGNGGGGGAGGLRTGTTTLTSGIVYTATVGGGGAGGGVNTGGTTGSSSVFNSITSNGGGGGGSGASASNAGASGGSGGGGSSPSGAGGAGTSGQGNNGGTGQGGNKSAGGGGAGAVGVYDGGVGSASSITGASVTYAGGGGGANYGNSAVVGVGGTGGGGNGGQGAGAAGSGTANTGGGGGAAGMDNTGVTGTAGTGGSGVVIISIPTTRYTGTTTGSPTVTTSGSNTILRFTASGSYTA